MLIVVAVVVVLLGGYTDLVVGHHHQRDEGRRRKESTFTPELLAADPDKELRWIGKVSPGGIFDGEHSFRIERLGPNRVRFVQEETFRGVAVPFLRSWLKAKIQPQFEAMNRALATRAEG